MDEDEIPDIAPDALPAPQGDHCEVCGKTPDHQPDGPGRVTLLAMQPGSDGKAWHLCARCWIPIKLDKPAIQQARAPKKRKAKAATQ